MRSLNSQFKLSHGFSPVSLADQSSALTGFIATLGVGITALMALAVGALNTMYSAVAARTREIATLRALHLISSPIVISVLL